MCKSVISINILNNSLNLMNFFTASWIPEQLICHLLLRKLGARSLQFILNLNVYGATDQFLPGLCVVPHLCGHLVGVFGRGINPSQGLYLHRTTQTHKITLICIMLRIRFKLMFSILERCNTVLTVNCVGAVIVSAALGRKPAGVGCYLLIHHYKI